jgi:hypothetical protein
VRRDLPFAAYEDIRSNLPVFLEYAFTKQRHPPFSWAEFVERWYGRPDTHPVRYEDLRSDPVPTLKRLVSDLSGVDVPACRVAEVVEEFSFARQAGRSPGREKHNSFMRKGIAGDWRNYFTYDAAQVFRRYAGAALIQLGYEEDDSWLNAFAGARDEQPVITPSPAALAQEQTKEPM